MAIDASMSGDHPRATPFGQLLRSLRMRALLSQEQLAQRSGLGVRTIRDLEGGRVSYPRGKSVQLLAAALELDGEARQAFELAARLPGVEPLAGRQPMAAALPTTGDMPLTASSDRDAVASTGDWRARTWETRGPVTVARQPMRPATIGWTVPAQLPMDTPVFAGRTGELAALDALLERADNGPAVVVAAIVGGPGVGKTALALHWAHLVGDRFPDGQIYVDLRGFDVRDPLSSSEAICGLLAALGVPSERFPRDPHAQVGLYRSLLHGQRVLILLDNARDVEHVRPLLPGARGCMVVVTSRQQLTGLIAVEGANPLMVDLLSMSEARELMARRLGRGRVRAELPAVDEIIDHCARLPLAMAVFASRVAAGPNFPLSTWAAELRDAQRGLDAFGVDAISDVRTSFSLSYEALSEDAAQLFRLFGRGQTVELVLESAAKRVSIPDRRARAAFGELSHAHLVVERRPGYFGTHKLLRAYAAELAATADQTVRRIDDPVNTELRTVPRLTKQGLDTRRHR